MATTVTLEMYYWIWLVDKSSRSVYKHRYLLASEVNNIEL